MPDNIYGLLGQPETQGGLLDPRMQALLAFGGQALAGSGWSATPQSFGQAIGPAVMQGMNAYNSGRRNAVQNALLKRTLARQDKSDALAERRVDLMEQRLQQGADDPAAVREWEYFQTLTPEQKRQYLAMKRAQQIREIGGVNTVIDPIAPGTGEDQPLSTLADEVEAAEAINASKEGYRRTEDGRLVPIEGAPASSTLEKRLFEVNDAAFKARSNQERYANIADQMLKVMPAAGEGAKWTENLKALTGQEDAVTNLRKQWNSLRVSAAVQNLPPGIASDKDIELVMSAFLPEFANPEAVASFMRGLSKLESIKGDYHEFEANYLSKKRSPVGLNKAWREHLESSVPEQPQVLRYNPETGTVE